VPARAYTRKQVGLQIMRKRSWGCPTLTQWCEALAHCAMHRELDAGTGLQNPRLLKRIQIHSTHAQARCPSCRLSPARSLVRQGLESVHCCSAAATGEAGCKGARAEPARGAGAPCAPLPVRLCVRYEQRLALLAGAINACSSGSCAAPRATSPPGSQGGLRVNIYPCLPPLQRSARPAWVHGPDLAGAAARLPSSRRWLQGQQTRSPATAWACRAASALVGRHARRKLARMSG